MLIKYHAIKYLILLSPKYDRYQRGLTSMVHEFFEQKTSGGTIKNKIISNKDLATELHKQIIRKFSNSKIHSPFIDNIWVPI